MPTWDSRQKSRFRRALLDWYDATKRDLPWRKITDPYAIWVSEIMLQQTTVRTVEPRWERFLKRFPTVVDLAEAAEESVQHEWTGLGYYARARNLHRAAKLVARDFAGVVPDRYEQLLALPGMGLYTAAAVASIAYGEPVAVVDANVERVVARLLAFGGNTRSAVGKRQLASHAQDLLDPSRAGDFNQAVMELGARICLPKRPVCIECPVAFLCRARAEGEPELYPKLPPKPEMESVREVAVLVEQRNRVLLLRRGAKGSFANMWEIPRGECAPDEEALAAAERILQEQTTLELVDGALVLRLKHVVMRKSIVLLVVRAKVRAGTVRCSEHEEARWTLAEEWAGLPKSTTQAKVQEWFATGRVEGPVRQKEERSPEEAPPDLFGDV